MYNNKTDFWKFFGTQLASGGMAGAASLTIVYPLDYARTRLASDVGTGKKQFNGLADCLKKTASGPGGFFSLYNGYTPSVAGIIAYRGAQFGLNDTIMAFNPYAKEFGVVASLWRSTCTRATWTVPPRFSRLRDSEVCTRELSPTFSVVSAHLLCSCSTERSSLPSREERLQRPNKCAPTMIQSDQFWC